MENYKVLWILRGLPGSGKSSVAQNLFVVDAIFEADQFWYDEAGNYNFNADRLPEAHEWCQKQVEARMEHDIEDAKEGIIFEGQSDFVLSEIVVSNTTTTEKEIEPYLELARKYDYKVVSLIVENRHGNKSIHNVPEEVMEKMKNRFSIKLR
jgi:predicted kinase